MAQVRLNFASCCRLCLTEKPEKAVFEEGIDDRSLQQKISTLVAVQISSNDKLSTMVCNKCLNKMSDWQSFKQSCIENQSKLEQLMQSADLSDMIIQIKEEPIDHELGPDVTIPEVVMNGGVKNEPIEVDYGDAPPTLTPYTADNDIEVVPNKGTSADPRQCPVCNKRFSLISNRKRHERTIHGKGMESDSPTLNGTSESSPPILTDDESQKIEFAAGLKLLQRNSVPHISLDEHLSKIELSYIEKCKAMAVMYKTLVCACHNVSHPNLKGLLSHLRSLRIWFPVFTCYHCMITFCDRSSSTRHHARCGCNELETLIKLSNLKKRSDVKTRLYQNYKCMKCKFMFSFHEDYCKHVDEEHCAVDMPITCDCGQVFSRLESYKDHIYISCLVNFYCDICFVTVKSLSEFQKHASELHDHSEGFVLLQDDNYRQRRSAVKRENLDDTAIVSGKRRISFKSPTDDDKVLNPLSTPKLTGSKCPICMKEYANYHNMWRHYKSHTTLDYDDSLYCCPDCGGMFSSQEWEKHKEMHKKKRCNECGKIFQFQSELDQHRSVHLNLKVYRDSKTKSYKSQMLSPTDNVMLLCELCDLMFSSKEELKDHKLNNHEQMPVLELQSEDKKKFACKLCNKHYAGYGGLWDHNRKKHPENKTPQSGEFPKQCKFCDKVLNTGGSYYMHKQMHLRIQQNAQSIQKKVAIMKRINKIEDEDEESYHTCKKCFKVFSNKYSLRNHMKCHGLNPPKSKKKVWCNVCHSAFDSSATLEKHKYEEHSIDEMPLLDEEEGNDIDLKSFIFTCDVCVQTFTTKTALKRHKEKHLEEQVLKETKNHLVYCKYCKISFKSTQALNNHMLKEHAENKAKPKVKSKKFPCDFCNKVFTSAMALGGHIGWHRRGKLPMTKTVKMEAVKNEPVMQFKCRTCLAVLPNDAALQLHILERHRNVNATILPARCTICNLDFASQEEYEKHRKFHEKVKSFKCNFCTASFSKLENLNEHIGRFHTKQEFKCPQCNRVFDKQNSLSIHLKVHEKQTSSRLKLFSCSICSLSFDVPKDLRQHTIQAHPF